MKIKIKIGTVVVEYEKETSASQSDAATAAVGYTKEAVHEQLMKTVSALCGHAKELYDKQNDFGT